MYAYRFYVPTSRGGECAVARDGYTTQVAPQADALRTVSKHGLLAQVVCVFVVVLCPSNIISGRVPTCDSAHSW